MYSFTGLTKVAARISHQAFSGRAVEKRYLALVRGDVDLKAIAATLSKVQLLKSLKSGVSYLRVSAGKITFSLSF